MSGFVVEISIITSREKSRSVAYGDIVLRIVIPYYRNVYLECYCQSFGDRYPDEDAGQIPLAFVVRKPGSNITAAQVMEFVAKQVCFSTLLMCSKIQILGE